MNSHGQIEAIKIILYIGGLVILFFLSGLLVGLYLKFWNDLLLTNCKSIIE